MIFESFAYRGQVYDLSHLIPFTAIYTQEARSLLAEETKPKKQYRCIVEFSGHCFTKSPNTRKGETLADFPSELHYPLEKETRVFCFERYHYSLRLPEIIRGLASRKCFFTSADSKFLTVEIQTENGRTLDYEIYFSLKKSRAKQYDIHLFINSAYIRSDDYKLHGKSVRRKPISFFILLNNTLSSKRIKKPY